MESKIIFLEDDLATRRLGSELALEWVQAKEKINSKATINLKLPILLLTGDLGTGKTTLVKGIGHSLGICDPITSPSFALAQHYFGAATTQLPTLIHLDLYRLENSYSADELFAQEEEEAIANGALMAVEWPERLSFFPKHAWEIKLKFASTFNPDLGRQALINR